MSQALAVNGGTPAVSPDLIEPWPHITDEDRAALAEVLSDSNIHVQRHMQADLLAKEWAEYMGRSFCIPTNSGTAALHMSVAALGIGRGDEVIVPAFTFWASAAAVLHNNAIPVFVDVEPETFCIDPNLIEEKITARTKAIMPVHIHGHPAEMNAIVDIATRHGLSIIEDAAQAHGARYDGRLCGAIGDVGAFSTQASKVLTTGSEGGLFVTDQPDLYERASRVQYFGEMVTPGRERVDQQYNASALGWMYRGDVFGQAFVRSQLRRLDERNAARVANCEYLIEHLSPIAGLSLPPRKASSRPIYYNFVIGFDPGSLGLGVTPRVLRDRVQHALRAEGVPVGLWQRVTVPAQEVFADRVGYGSGCPWSCNGSLVEYQSSDYPVANSFLDSHTYLFDIHPPNGVELMARYVEAFEKVMEKADELADPPDDADDQWVASRLEWSGPV